MDGENNKTDDNNNEVNETIEENQNNNDSSENQEDLENKENTTDKSELNAIASASIDEANVGNIQNIESAVIQHQTLLDYFPHIIIGLIGLAVLFGIGFMFFKGDAKSFTSGDAATTRGLITFLVAVVTIAIAVILTLSAVLSNSNEFKERFALGKEVLTILIGVLGTIIGFYFGSADKTTIVNAATQPSEVSSQTLRISPPNLTNEQVTNSSGTTISSFISGGKPPYKFKITFDTTQIPEINGDSTDGIIKAEIQQPSSGFDKDTQVAYRIEVSDSDSKKEVLTEDKVKKFTVKATTAGTPSNAN